jgi:hypothetical protein
MATGHAIPSAITPTWVDPAAGTRLNVSPTAVTAQPTAKGSHGPRRCASTALPPTTIVASRMSPTG